MTLWPLFLGAALLNLLLAWRDKPLRYLALLLLAAWAGANLAYAAYDTPDRITANALVDLGFGIGAMWLFTKTQLWNAAAIAFVAIMACCLHFSYAALPEPLFWQSHLYEVLLNVMFVICLAINSGGRLWGYVRMGFDRIRGRYRDPRPAVRSDGQ